jgi:hypothetical protein
MYKLIFLFNGLLLLACNNQSTTAGPNKDSVAKSAAAGTNKFTADELEFLAPCFDNAKNNLGEDRAYTLCRCLYEQVQKKYPGADSTTLMQHLSDTAEVRQMTQNCQ